jgi:hypothetical protein
MFTAASKKLACAVKDWKIGLDYFTVNLAGSFLVAGGNKNWRSIPDADGVR